MCEQSGTSVTPDIVVSLHLAPHVKSLLIAMRLARGTRIPTIDGVIFSHPLTLFLDPGGVDQDSLDNLPWRGSGASSVPPTPGFPGMVQYGVSWVLFRQRNNPNGVAVVEGGHCRP